MDVEKVLRECRELAGTVLLVALTAVVVSLPVKQTTKVVSNIDQATTNLNKTILSLHDLVTMLSTDYYDPENPKDGFYVEIRSDLAESLKASKATNSLILDIHSQLTGKDGVLPSVNSLLSSSRVVIDDLDVEVKKFGDVLGPLSETMSHVDSLSKELEDELKSGGNVDKTFVALAQAVADFDKQLRDPNITAILANSANTTKSIANTSETLDIVTRPWRKKVNQLKAVLKAIGNFLKVTVPLPF